jgi:hypothetical protein
LAYKIYIEVDVDPGKNCLDPQHSFKKINFKVIPVARMRRLHEATPHIALLTSGCQNLKQIPPTFTSLKIIHFFILHGTHAQIA